MSEKEQTEFKEDVYSKSVRAGKRTYYFDVKSTKNNDFFLTITESKRVFQADGKFTYEKHKIFLYREDYEKFLEGLQGSLQFIKQNLPTEKQELQTGNEYSNLQFDDLEIPQ